MPLEINEVLKRSPVIPVLVIDDLKDAKPLAQALFKGGLPVLEVTLRSPVAMDAALEMKQAVPEAIVGLGTITTPALLEDALASNLDFGVSPGMSSDLLSHLRPTKFPFLPGTGTMSEVMELHAAGFDAFKFFPAEASGGTAFLKSVQSVMPHVAFCPTGGINADNASAYLAIDIVKAVGGSWIAPPDLVRANDWPEIEARARLASKLGAA
ncbi:UNVERIFIED_CONTAM: hypothetical protein GTU68_024195 [Idotea baltica]|nr:hypothetical protein [Idotea baltica]